MMHQLHLEAMVDLLIKDNFLPQDGKELAVQCIAQYWKDQVADIWTVGDVQSIAAGANDEQAMEILNQVTHSEPGITWDKIEHITVAMWPELILPECDICGEACEETDLAPFEDFENVCPACRGDEHG